MDKRDLTVGIIDVDANFKSAMKEALEKEGYTCVVFSDVDQLMSSIKLRKFHVFIIECLTQKTSLNNLAKSLKQEMSDALFIYVSLILDKSAVRDAMNMTQSQHFFKKPVMPAQILGVIKEKFSTQVTEEHEPILEILYSAQLTSQERIGAIKKTQMLHGFEVPRILSYLSRTQFNGTIKFKAADVKDSVVYFKNGAIIKVEVDDPKSFFGAILVDKNFLNLEELELVLQQKSTKRIGERLVESNLVSPHVIDLVNIEQQGIRLGYIIKNTSYDIEFEEKALEIEALTMDHNSLSRFVSEWLNSKISLSWLRSFYLPFVDKKILRASQFADISPIHTYYPLNRMPKFAQDVIQGLTIEQILEQKKYSEEDVLKGVHLLLILEFICFDKQAKQQDHKSHLERLQKIKSDMEIQNHFEVLGLNEKAKSKEIKRAYYELSKLFHPDKVSAQAPQEIRDLTSFIFAKVSKAHEVLEDETKRASYLKELEKGFAEKILESESYFEEGKSLLKSNQPTKAVNAFETAMSLRPPTSELRLYLLWAKILSVPQTGIERYLTEIEADLNRIPPEDRHNSTYYFVKGLYLKQIGDLESAEKTIRHALSLTPNFMEAQREINILSLQKKSNKQVDLLNADLKDVVGMLFKKKK